LTKPTQKRLKELLNYDPNTGLFRWKGNFGHGTKEGKIAGTLRKANDRQSGRRAIGIDGKIYRAHHLAWLYMTGNWPSRQVDHCNRIKSDDRWENLRLATQEQNSRNRNVRKDSKSRIMGFIGNQTIRHGMSIYKKNLLVISKLSTKPNEQGEMQNWKCTVSSPPM
jgi:hypothetical protein